MKSHRCEKTRGVGHNSIAKLPPQAQTDLTLGLCQYLNGRGHRCRMHSLDASGLCVHHARRLRLQEAREREQVAAELLDSVGNFTSLASVNRFLANLIGLVARDRVNRRDAMALAYISQLLLNCLSAMLRQQEKKQVPPRVEYVFDWPSRDKVASEGQREAPAQGQGQEPSR